VNTPGSITRAALLHAVATIIPTTLAVVILVAGFTACGPMAPDTSTALGAYDVYRAAVDRGAWEEVFPLLVPEVKDKITKTWEINKKTALLIENSLPAPLKMNFIAEIGPEPIRNAGTPGAYFAATVNSSRRIVNSQVQSISSVVSTMREEPKGSGRWTILPLSGQPVNVIYCEDGNYHIVPDPQDLKQIKNAFVEANDRYARIRQVIDSLGKDTRPAPR
jgi:hypothetical protein